MRKTMMICLALTMVLLVQAQSSLKVTPKMVKGDKRVYTIQSIANVAGQGEVKTTVESQYTVAKVTAEGYEVEVCNTQMASDLDGSNLMNSIVSLSTNMLNGFTMRLSFDKDGKIVKIMNYEEVRQKMEVYLDKAVDELLEAMPQVDQLVSKETLKEQALAAGSEEALIKSLQSATSVMALNGKTLTNGMEETVVNIQGMKMKRTYTLDGKTVVSEAVSDMNKDDMKSFIISQIERVAPDQASMVKDNIDTVMSTGLLKLDMSEKATYTLGDDLWVKSLEASTTNNIMGQSSSVITHITLK